MDTSSGARKRNISELLDQEAGSENDERQGLGPPKARRRLEKDVHSQLESRTRVLDTSENEKPLNRTVSGKSAERVEDKARESAFLAYPDLSNPKPISTPFQQPSQLISFSYTPGHVQEFTNSALRYFVDPPLGANLSYGYERWIKRPDERGRVDALLKAISKVKRDAEGNGAKFPEIGVISWRGVMTKYVLRATIELIILYFLFVSFE
jgi:RAT1-interacting protein